MWPKNRLPGTLVSTAQRGIALFPRHESVRGWLLGYLISFSISHGCQYSWSTVPPSPLPPPPFFLPSSPPFSYFPFPTKLLSTPCCVSFMLTLLLPLFASIPDIFPFFLPSYFQAQWYVLPYFSLFPLPSTVMCAPLFFPFPTSKYSDACSHISPFSHFQAQWCVLPYFSSFPLQAHVMKCASLFLHFPISKYSNVCFHISSLFPLPSTVMCAPILISFPASKHSLVCSPT